MDLWQDATAAALEVIDPERIYLIGYALGGKVGLLTAALVVRVKALAVIAGFDPLRLDTQEKGVEGTLPSGLQYKILKAGERPKKLTDADTVECQYRGTLVDGKEFDSSYELGKPVTFKVSQVIAGWQEALKLMPVGSKWQIVIPPQLAYGDRGAGIIGPNSTLVFEVELVSIKDKS